MIQSRSRQKLESMLTRADIRFDGDRPWDVQVRNESLFDRVLAYGNLGAGEAYMDGWWDCESLDDMVCRIWQSDLPVYMRQLRGWPSILADVLINRQRGRRAFKVGKQHYDLGNALYECMLDERMIYSCGYWKDATNLDQAQEAKLDLIARKLQLEPGMTVLDIGCGWGVSMAYLQERYGISGLGITVSDEQVKLAREKYSCADLRFERQDYRSVTEIFDRIFSVGMFEHVGIKNYPRYFEMVRNCLRDEGLFLLHTIGCRKSESWFDPWLERYIFPNYMLPAAKQIISASEQYLILEDWHSFGADYDRTTLAWHANFCSGWEQLKPDYDERFFRMWSYYLLSCAGTFRAGVNQLWQVVFSKDGLTGGYRAENIR